MLSLRFANPQKTRIIRTRPLMENPRIPHPRNLRIPPRSPNRLNHAKPRTFVPLPRPLLRNLRDLVLPYLKKNAIAVRLQDSASTAANPVTGLSNALDCKLL